MKIICAKNRQIFISVYFCNIKIETILVDKSTGNVNTVHISLTIVLPVLPLKWNLSLDKIDVVRFRSRLVNSNTIFNRNDVLLLRTYQHGLERYYHLCIIKRFLYI
jgi:hypothetical protein